MQLINVLKATGVAVTLGVVAGSFQQSEAALLEATSGGALYDIENLNLNNGQNENNFIVGFDELQDVSVSSPLKVDYLISSDDIGKTFKGVNNPSNTSPFLNEGVYDSHLFHFDPATHGGNAGSVSFTFDGEIAAIISNTTYLNETDSLFGAAAQYAKGVDRRSESHESFTIVDSNTLRLDNFKVGGGYIDNLRVLTVAPPTKDVPEPAAALALSALGVLGVAKKLLGA